MLNRAHPTTFRDTFNAPIVFSFQLAGLFSYSYVRVLLQVISNMELAAWCEYIVIRTLWVLLVHC